MPHPVDIGQVLLDAAVFDLKSNTHGTLMDHDTIPKHAEEFLDLLDENDIDYMLVNGLAMLSHIEGRNTKDIDIVVAFREVRDLPLLEIREHDEHFALASYKSLRVDILRSEIKFFRDIKKRFCEPRQFASRTIPCATPLGLILLKLQALPALYRQFQMSKVTIYEGDIQNLLVHEPHSHDEIMTELKSYIPESEYRELDSILREIEERIEKAKTRFKNP